MRGMSETKPNVERPVYTNAAGTFELGEGQLEGVEALEDFFARTPRMAVAFSGGVDSAFLLASSKRAGVEVKAYIVRTAFQPASEIADALRLVEELGVAYELIDLDIFEHPEVCANPPERCYLCKRVIFGTIAAAAARDGFPVVCDGTNTRDLPERRPGFKVLAEVGVVSPLRRAGMDKEAIRAASRELGLFTSEKPSFSCIAIHVPEGEAITPQTLEETKERLGI